MELEICASFEKHYNDYQSKEEVSRTKKNLKRQIKELEESSSSDSGSEYDESHQQDFVAQCDNIMRIIDAQDKSIFQQSKPLFEEIVPEESKAKSDSPIYAKDLNREILIKSEINNDVEQSNIGDFAQLDCDKLPKSDNFPDFQTEFEEGSDNDDLFRKAKDWHRPSFPIPEAPLNSSELSEGESDLSEESVEAAAPSGPATIQINHDRRQATVRVSKTKTRSEKRAARKEAKQAQLRDKLKRLQNARALEMRDRLAKALQHAPQLAGLISVADVDDDDFDINEWSAKLTNLYEQDGDMPEDHKKPVFSDDSDCEHPAEGEWSGCEQDSDDGVTDNHAGEGKKSKKKSKKSNKITEPDQCANQKPKAAKREFFTNVELPESEKKPKIATGIARKPGASEQFCREKHHDFGSYLKKNFDFLCEDVIRGRDDSDDVLCRFRFRKVEKQDYGLNTDEIILADDKELNQWASLKKVVRYRTASEENADRLKYATESMQAKKQKVLASLYREESESEQEPAEAKEDDKTTQSKSSRKRMRKLANKKRLKHIENVEEDDQNVINDEEKEDETVKGKDKKKKRKLENDSKDESIKEVDQTKSKKLKNEENENVKIKSKKEKNKLNEEKIIDDITDKDIETKEKVKTDENKIGKKDKKKKKSVEEDKIISNDKDVKRKSETVKDIGNEAQKDKETEKKQDGKVKHTKTHKSKKNKTSSVPVLNANRLESLGIKPGYYKHVLMDPKSKE